MKRLIILALAGAIPTPLLAQAEVTPPPMEARTSAGTYVRMAASSDTYEKQSSQMILSSAKNPDVRSYAQKMVDDHTQTTAKLMAAAKEASIGGPPNLLPNHARLLDGLRKAPDNEKERAYMAQQIVAHKEALMLHQGYAKQGDNPALRQVAAAAVPIIQSHLTEAQRIYDSMGGATAS